MKPGVYKEGKYTITVWNNGDIMWCLNGKRHREDGPAWIYKFYEIGVWYLEDKMYSEKDWKKEMRNRKLRKLGY